VFDSSKFSEVQNHLTLWDYVLDSTGWYISLKTLNEKLNDAQRKIVTESAAEAIKWAENYLGDSEKKILEKLKSEGVEITALNDDEKKAFKEATQPLYTKYEPIIGKNVFDLFRRVGGN
jgi:TRAP-type C4-dicarboxylate transport system substrate-binding protein